MRACRLILLVLIVGGSVALTFAFRDAEAAPIITLEQIAANLADAVAITHAGDESGRLFITLQAGQIVIYDGTRVVSTPFLDISPLVLCCGERGLLSVAFHPNYRANGLFYVNYTRRPDGATVIARYSVSSNPNVADPNSAVVLLTIPQPFANHNGGQLQFGPDGYLYIGMGDGGGAGDPQDNAQNLGTLLGKILRIDVDGGSPYRIPPDNPFVENPDDPATLGEIWALGLRNPWRFSFDRGTRDLFIGDVGQGSREEVDFQPAGSPGGQNYGWRLMEGTLCFNPSSNCNDGTLTLPILEYDHSLGCSITGGYRYRGSQFPELNGTYFYADFCSGRIWGATRNSDGSWTTSQLLDTPHSITTFGEDEVGEMYLAHYSSSGAIYRIVGQQRVRLIGGFDGDGRADIAVFRPGPRQWRIQRSSDGQTQIVQWGGLGAAPVPADFDGDGRADVAIFRPPRKWRIQRSSDGQAQIVPWGDPGDLPV